MAEVQDTALARLLGGEIGSESDLNSWLVDMCALGYVDLQSQTVNQKLKQGQRDDFVTRTITDYVYEFAYNEHDPEDIYYRKRGANEPFRRFPYDKKQLTDVIVKLYKKFFKMTTHSETEACAKNVIDNITRAADLQNGLWYAGGNLFWDSEPGELITPDGLKGRDSFREIGSTSRCEELDTVLLKKTFDEWTDRLNTLTNEYGEFDNFYKQLSIEHDHFKLWACIDTDGGVDRYWDMCVATSTIFMYSPPPIAYIPKGKPRGGKSTFIKHLHYLVGDWQTSEVQMSQLTDLHFCSTMYGSLLNAPDEDKSGDLGDNITAVFKSLAAKESCNLPVMYSSKPKKMKLKFMMFFPRNVLPDFGTESAACMKRLRFIFCNADLSEYDKRPIDFVKVTFKDHPEYLSKYMGFILALSGYFQKNGMWYSKTMMESSDYVAETVNSTSLYYKMWKKFYAGYESFELLWADYVNFCKERGYDAESKINLREAFSIEGQNRDKRYYPGCKKNIWMYMTRKDYGKGQYDLGYKILCKDEYYQNIGTPKERALEGGASMVDVLDNIERNKENEFLGGEK